MSRERLLLAVFDLIFIFVLVMLVYKGLTAGSLM